MHQLTSLLHFALRLVMAGAQAKAWGIRRRER